MKYIPESLQKILFGEFPRESLFMEFPFERSMSQTFVNLPSKLVIHSLSLVKDPCFKSEIMAAISFESGLQHMLPTDTFEFVIFLGSPKPIFITKRSDTSGACSKSRLSTKAIFLPSGESAKVNISPFSFVKHFFVPFLLTR